MPQCKKCRKKGLFFKLEKRTGLCLSCNTAFMKSSKELTEKITEDANLIRGLDDPKAVVSRCDQVEGNAQKLISLHKEYSLEVGSALMHVVKWCRRIKQKTLSTMEKNKECGSL
jgi:hypothetical protein